MKILSWNIRGIGNEKKQLKIKKFVKNQCPDVVFLQETKAQLIDKPMIKSLWSSKDIGWSSLDSIGKAGGLLITWDESKICVKEVMEGSFSLSICISFSSSIEVWLTNVYDPSNYRERKHFWS